MVQLGDGGSPIEFDEDWLLLTHGVGAVLLDKEDPGKVVGRMRHPLISPANEDREGHVPNVVDTCGALKRGDQLSVPCGVADRLIETMR